MNNTGTADMSVLNQGNLNSSAVGCNAYDGWPVFNGNIGDVFVYKVAIDDTKRTDLEASLTAKFGTAAMYTIAANADTGGSISPAGPVAVPQNADQAFTITPAPYFDVASVILETATAPIEVVAGPNAQTYTFLNVTADHTIDASFTAWVDTEITGKVTLADMDMTPVGGVVVTATGPRGPFTGTTADSDGTYMIRVRPDETYTLTAYKAGFIASPASLTAGTGDLTGKDFTLEVNPPHTQPMFVNRGTGGWRNDTWTIGSRIRTGASSVYVTKLGYVDRDQNGFNVTHQVGIWDAAGALLGSVTVPAGTDGELIGDFRYAPLGSVIVLAPNTSYALGGYTQGDDWGDASASPGFNEPDFVGFTSESAIAHDGGAGFSNPNPNGGGFDWGACCAAVNVFGSTSLSAVLPPEYAAWIATYPTLNGANALPGADPDRDGMTNQEEFAFGLDPSLGTSVNPITAPLDRATGKFSYTQRVGSGLAYGYEYSSTMADGDWHPFLPASTSSDSGTPVAVITIEVPGDLLLANPSLFVRVVAQ
ncbi:MAG: carboxypeptidase-like regulatory domain-containing protein [Verrucomicrobia bacterium]|nr:carboxypeptidase-like regulatory domain-containing protein [Verrucomicrobiota bacterium]